MKEKTTLGLLGGLGVLALSFLAARPFIFKRPEINLKTEQGIERFVLPDGPDGYQCSDYARQLATKFGKTFSQRDAWDRVYFDEIEARIYNNQDLKDYEQQGKLKPGMLIGVKYPGSSFREGKDFNGNPRQFTHTMCYIGKDEKGELVFAESIGGNEKFRRLSEFGNLEAKYVFSEMKKR